MFCNGKGHYGDMTLTDFEMVYNNGEIAMMFVSGNFVLE
jgi:hypothetical protein